MAIFSKNNTPKENESAVAPVKKESASPSKGKKTVKPAKDAGANLTKSPGRILHVPRITEKAAYMTLQNGYVFEVAMDATKRDISSAVRALYHVVPVKVNIVVKKPRAFVSRSRKRRGVKAGMKKAYVFLKKGEKIDIF